MPNPLDVLLDATVDTAGLVPLYARRCRITNTSPLTVSMGTQDGILGVAIAGLTYTVSGTSNNALALLTGQSKPIILPTS